jgi:hypothetical protein
VSCYPNAFVLVDLDAVQTIQHSHSPERHLTLFNKKKLRYSLFSRIASAPTLILEPTMESSSCSTTPGRPPSFPSSVPPERCRPPSSLSAALLVHRMASALHRACLVTYVPFQRRLVPGAGTSRPFPGPLSLSTRVTCRSLHQSGDLRAIDELYTSEHTPTILHSPKVQRDVVLKPHVANMFQVFQMF